MYRHRNGKRKKNQETCRKRTGNKAPVSLCSDGSKQETSGKPSKPGWKRETAKSSPLVSILCGFHERIFSSILPQPTFANSFCCHLQDRSFPHLHFLSELSTIGYAILDQ